MDLIEKIMLPPHIVAGFLSIALFWLPAFTRKGGISHIRMGKLYIFFMWIVVVTAALMCLENVWYGFYAGGSFLGFLALITASPLWRGIAILRNKKAITPKYRRINLTLELAIFLFGAALLVAGILLQSDSTAILMMVFGGLGISNAGRLWRMIRRPSQQSDWLIQHMKDMIASGIAAYTAFFAFGGRTLLGEIFTDNWMVIPWMAPTVIGITSMRLLEKAYRRKRQSKETLPVGQIAVTAAAGKPETRRPKPQTLPIP
ncbi:MAG TPA: hypothetical protein PKA00_04695 [Saprospiraceae bacterium]|nr:hypothetical protein [Saprospiraceae bacterium]HMQ82179.1 hypothetical protein [Saprospiraceae bacterium]